MGMDITFSVCILLFRKSEIFRSPDLRIGPSRTLQLDTWVVFDSLRLSEKTPVTCALSVVSLHTPLKSKIRQVRDGSSILWPV